MRQFPLTFIILLLLFQPARFLWASPSISISPVIPSGFGLNVHFKYPAPGEMEMLVDSGIRWLRVDFYWSQTEKIKGQYDFSIFEPLVTLAKQNNIRLLFILAYGNPLYDDGGPPRSPEAIQAFANWAAAATKHFQGHQILWEVWNEPSGDMFWPPKRNVDEYSKLALAVGKKVQQEAPHETLIGPALSRMDWDYLESTFKAGLLNYWSGVSVHPYRETKHPETINHEILRLKKLISRYAPQGKNIPIISSEWGYPSISGDVDEITQASYLVRMLLNNLYQGIPLSIWYDWRNNGSDPNEREHHFGTVHQKFYHDRTPPFDAKPSFHALQTLNQTLEGFYFKKRILVARSTDYIFMFAKEGEIRLAFWSSSPQTKTYPVSLNSGEFQIIDLFGSIIKTWKHSGKRPAKITLKQTPQYLTIK